MKVHNAAGEILNVGELIDVLNAMNLEDVISIGQINGEYVLQQGQSGVRFPEWVVRLGD